MSITGTISDSINDSLAKTTVVGSTIAGNAMNGAAHLSEEIGHLFTSIAETADSKLHPVVVKKRWQGRRPALLAAVVVLAIAAVLYRRRRDIGRRDIEQRTDETAAQAKERLRSVTP